MAKDDDDTRTRAGSGDREAAADDKGKEEAAPAAGGNKLLLPMIAGGVIVVAAAVFFLLRGKKPPEHAPTRAELFSKSRLLIDDRVQDQLQAESQSRVLVGQTLSSAPPASGAESTAGAGHHDTGHAEAAAEKSHGAEPAPKGPVTAVGDKIPLPIAEVGGGGHP
ncbi:MAG: hypothetical protein HQL66_14425 [Magnetococcales bacterium]|nr:hypothetical protein [Magnetococcales bacterium]